MHSFRAQSRRIGSSILILFRFYKNRADFRPPRQPHRPQSAAIADRPRAVLTSSVPFSAPSVTYTKRPIILPYRSLLSLQRKWPELSIKPRNSYSAHLRSIIGNGVARRPGPGRARYADRRSPRNCPGPGRVTSGSPAPSPPTASTPHLPAHFSAPTDRTSDSVELARSANVRRPMRRQHAADRLLRILQPLRSAPVLAAVAILSCGTSQQHAGMRTQNGSDAAK